MSLESAHRVVATVPPSGSVRNDLSTALVRVYREMFGRGPVKTTTHAFDAGYVTFLRDVLAPHERLLVLGGRADLVRETRTAVREARREHVIAEVHRLTGHPVLHDSFEFQPERDLAIELFWIPPDPQPTEVISEPEVSVRTIRRFQ